MIYGFRVDSSYEIGIGHVMRCIALARELTCNGTKCLFICVNHPGNIISEILSAGFEVLEIEPTVNCDWSKSPDYKSWLGNPVEVDLFKSLNIITERLIDCMIVDHYGISRDWEWKVSRVVRKLLVIDDLHNRHHYCNYLINPNLGVQTSDYHGMVNTECKVLAGPRYAFLREEFHKVTHQKKNSVRQESQKKKKTIIGNERRALRK